MSQDQLAALVVHSRTLIASVELGERWPPRDLAVRCDEVLGGHDALTRLWPLVDAERQAARVVMGFGRPSCPRGASVAFGKPDRAAEFAAAELRLAAAMS